MTTEATKHARVIELARAKVNLALHITGQRSDGYHMLDSLVVFPHIGDEISVKPASRLSLSIAGQFAEKIQGDPADNLIYKAAQLLTEHVASASGARIELDKSLPVAAGIGGGSADAAATLRALAKIWGTCPSSADLSRLSLSLGADVPMCLEEKPARIRGIGEVIEPLPAFPSGAIVLVNPLIEVATPAVFNALLEKNHPPLPELPDGFKSMKDLASWLKTCRNDLQKPAIAQASLISTVLDILASQPETLLARMSGSGATCFALCESLSEAQAIAARLQEHHGNWWIKPARI
ncbi:4-diphosphocytidyl-2-C-methyl-D-erythritol kinase [Pseudovibrio axinellae]|uniref:4-diphosphocytidyl-2-C-methyl-D-erythritol kinase n=1 Tax=Pseudovibrio axinellae TaxID=989403 RepID=A0A166ALI3_9HYPH|nr:4-(cytidine 5'-diphospho)-2-C-methyl-D-erythritol kinase [Pseudovibrio axinellae]KZL21275.1 4-diphosphocytidyl-2-C-methyl-D-erythritol kinase [Pseudovibrio axinellae]SEQ94409.1 4-diphosphocytidyl-2-C-methyl-D-erythritol kinase [Pseudovibrio axinellae]